MYTYVQPFGSRPVPRAAPCQAAGEGTGVACWLSAADESNEESHARPASRYSFNLTQLNLTHGCTCTVYRKEKARAAPRNVRMCMVGSVTRKRSRSWRSISHNRRYRCVVLKHRAPSMKNRCALQGAPCRAAGLSPESDSLRLLAPGQAVRSSLSRPWPIAPPASHTS